MAMGMRRCACRGEADLRGIEPREDGAAAPKLCGGGALVWGLLCGMDGNTATVAGWRGLGVAGGLSLAPQDQADYPTALWRRP